MKQLVCIVGSTGTGKTALALNLARLFPSILISADSRQVYRGMDIVTGKDHPKNVELLGIDMVNPDETCSVALWHKQVTSGLTGVKLPIVVGGTGLYVRALTDGIPTIGVAPNAELRQELADKSVEELQSQLKKVDTHKLTSMNKSDAHNPRRLIRAIEIAVSKKNVMDFEPPSTVMIGLRHSNDMRYEAAVRTRVAERLKHGAIEETSALAKKYAIDVPAMSALGYKHIIKFLRRELSKEELIDAWTHDELAYAKRQRTWFKKIANIHWFEASDPTASNQVVKLLKSWYHKDR